MLTIRPDACYTTTKLDAEELYWLYQGARKDDDLPVLHYIDVEPHVIQACNGFVCHRILSDHICTPGLYLLNGGKPVKKSPASYSVETYDQKEYPDVERIIPIGTQTYKGPAVSWTVRVEQAELLWALEIPDTLAVILALSAEGVFSVQKARAAYDRVEGMPDATSAYIQHEVLTNPDNPTEFQIGVNPKLLIAAAQMPNSPFLLLSFTDAKHAFVIQSIGFEYQAIVMPMHIGR